LKVFIIQSNYIPWKGYFDAIQLADVVVLYDEMQYTKNDWRNRNKIKTPQVLQWLTIPIKVKNNAAQKINEAEVFRNHWATKHWKSIQQNYSNAPHFKKYQNFFSDLFQEASELTSLSKINFLFLSEISKLLGIQTKFLWSKDFELRGNKTEKLVNLCNDLKVTNYLSGPSAKNYLEEDFFLKNNIEVKWLDYSDYPKYTQLHGEFEHGVSIIDLILNTGTDAKKFMKYF